MLMLFKAVHRADTVVVAISSQVRLHAVVVHRTAVPAGTPWEGSQSPSGLLESEALVLFNDEGSLCHAFTDQPIVVDPQGKLTAIDAEGQAVVLQLFQRTPLTV